MKFSGIIALAMTLVCTPALAQVTPGTSPLSIPKGGTGGSSWIANTPVIGNGTGPLQQGTLTGNTTKFVTSTGALTPGHCMDLDSNLNLIDSGAGCGSGTNTLQNQIFAAPGAVTTLTLTNTPLPATSLQLSIYFDGVFQVHSTWSVNTTTGVITFNSAIPVSVQEVEALWSGPLSAIGPSPTLMTNVAALRANTSTFSNVYLMGYTSVSDGGEGSLNYVASDTTTADNNCTIFVDAAGHRFYRSFVNNISVKWCGATGLGVVDDTLPIQRAINFARNYNVGILSSGGGLCVVFPSGNYVISGLDATNWTSGCMKGPGGSQAVSIYAANQVSSIPVLDLTGTAGSYFANLNFSATTTGGAAPSVQPSVGFLMANDNGATNNNSDLNRFDFVVMTGYFNTAACYIYAVTDLIFTSVNCLELSTTAGFGLIASATNIFGVSSPYQTISTGTGVVADITWYGGAAGIGSFATNASGLLLSACQSCRFRDGVFASGATGNFVQIQSTNFALTFDNIQLNDAVVTRPTNVFFFSSATVNGLSISNMQVVGQYSGLFLAGSGLSCTGCAVVGQDPSIISGGVSASFSHLP